jgi:hypothetical protein
MLNTARGKFDTQQINSSLGDTDEAKKGGLQGQLIRVATTQ